jgi:hypothetical protein
MDEKSKLMQAALKTVDPIQLVKIVEQALQLAAFNESQLVFSKVREQKLQAQVARQTATIINFEKTLWSKKG